MESPVPILAECACLGCEFGSHSVDEIRAGRCSFVTTDIAESTTNAGMDGDSYLAAGRPLALSLREMRSPAGALMHDKTGAQRRCGRPYRTGVTHSDTPLEGERGQSCIAR